MSPAASPTVTTAPARATHRRVRRWGTWCAVCLFFGVAMTFAVAWLPLASGLGARLATYLGGPINDVRIAGAPPTRDWGEGTYRLTRADSEVHEFLTLPPENMDASLQTDFVACLASAPIGYPGSRDTDSLARYLRSAPPPSTSLDAQWERFPGYGLLIDAGWPCRAVTGWFLGYPMHTPPYHVADRLIVLTGKAGHHPGADPTHPALLPYRPLWPGFAINTLIYASLLALLVFVWTWTRRALRRRRNRCLHCGYALAGLTPTEADAGPPARVCPECGHATHLRRPV